MEVESRAPTDTLYTTDSSTSNSTDTTNSPITDSLATDGISKASTKLCCNSTIISRRTFILMVLKCTLI